MKSLLQLLIILFITNYSFPQNHHIQKTDLPKDRITEISGSIFRSMHKDVPLMPQKRAAKEKGAAIDYYRPVQAVTDTSRYSYTYNNNGDLLTWLWEKPTINGWVNYWHETRTYDNSGNMVTDLMERWQDNAWVNSFRTTSTYDGSGNMLSSHSETWNNNTWVNSRLETYTYNGSGLQLSQAYQVWQNGVWENLWRYSSAYDNSGKILSYLYETGEGVTWVNFDRRSYTYNFYGNTQSILSERWTNGAWVNRTKESYIYAYGKIAVYITENWENGSWVNSNKYNYMYDNNGNTISIFIQRWDSGNWVNKSQYIFTYNSVSDMLTEIYQIWHNGIWIDSQRATYTYNDHHSILTLLLEYLDNGTAWRTTNTFDFNENLLSRTIEYWQNGGWMNKEKYLYTFDVNGINAVRGEYFRWTDGEWVPDTGPLTINYNNWNDQEYYFCKWVDVQYDMFTGINDLPGNEITYSLENNYPNPFNPATTISYTIPRTSMVQLKIYDITGSEVALIVNEEKPAGTYKLIWTAENLPSGVYFYRLKAGSFSETKKMTLVK